MVNKKLDPKAKVRNRGKVVFPANSKKVKDNKDHFPINDEDQARDALGRVGEYSSVPPWYSGTLQELKSAVQNAVSREYKGIKVTKTKSEYSFAAFLILAEEDNLFTGPQKPTDGGKKKKKKKVTY